MAAFYGSDCSEDAILATRNRIPADTLINRLVLEMVAFTRQALSIAPASKLVYSSDGIYVPEMYWASALRGRSILGQVLQEVRNPIP